MWFVYSEAEPKGSDCYETFKVMQDCMTQYPAVYNAGADEEDREEDEEEGGSSVNKSQDATTLPGMTEISDKALEASVQIDSAKKS